MQQPNNAPALTGAELCALENFRGLLEGITDGDRVTTANEILDVVREVTTP